MVENSMKGRQIIKDLLYMGKASSYYKELGVTKQAFFEFKKETPKGDIQYGTFVKYLKVLGAEVYMINREDESNCTLIDLESRNGVIDAIYPIMKAWDESLMLKSSGRRKHIAVLRNKTQFMGLKSMNSTRIYQFLDYAEGKREDGNFKLSPLIRLLDYYGYDLYVFCKDRKYKVLGNTSNWK